LKREIFWKYPSKFHINFENDISQSNSYSDLSIDKKEKIVNSKQSVLQDKIFTHTIFLLP